MNYEKIASITGTSVGGAKANFHQALKKMEEILNMKVDYNPKLETPFY